MTADVKNNTDQTIDLGGGFVLVPGTVVRIPPAILAAPYTRRRIKAGEIIVNPKPRRARQQEPEQEEGPSEPAPPAEPAAEAE